MWLRNLFHLVADSLESLGIIHCEIGEHLAVDLDACLMNKTHQLAVGEVFHTGCSIDSLNPESAEVALFLLAVAVGIGKTFFPCVLRNGPYIATATEITAGEF